MPDCVWVLGIWVLRIWVLRIWALGIWVLGVWALGIRVVVPTGAVAIFVAITRALTKPVASATEIASGLSDP